MTYLPTSFNAIEVTGERASQEPHLGEAELTGHLHTGTPHIHGALCSVVCIPLHVPNGMLCFSTTNQATSITLSLETKMDMSPNFRRIIVKDWQC